jgi:hypothetical protein
MTLGSTLVRVGQTLRENAKEHERIISSRHDMGTHTVIKISTFVQMLLALCFWK